MSYTTLPAGPQQAIQKLKQIVGQPDMTVLLVFGKDETARNARAYSKALAEIDDYVSVAFVEAAEPDGLLPYLQQLPDPKVSLDSLDDYIALSISPDGNSPAYLVSRAQFEHAKGYIKTAILRAMAV